MGKSKKGEKASKQATPEDRERGESEALLTEGEHKAEAQPAPTPMETNNDGAVSSEIPQADTLGNMLNQLETAMKGTMAMKEQAIPAPPGALTFQGPDGQVKFSHGRKNSSFLKRTNLA